MIDCLGLNVDDEIVEGNIGKYLHNLKEGKASNHNTEVISAQAKWRRKPQIIVYTYVYICI